MSNSSTSNDDMGYNCLNSKIKFYLNIAIIAVRTILLLPLCTFILYLGHHQWQQQRSFKTASHSDLFTYHLSTMELIWVIGYTCYYCGQHIQSQELIKGGLCVSTISTYGGMFFHILTCGERYLAVVHPVIYMGLRSARGIRIRNICIGCVWLLCFVIMSLYGSIDYTYVYIISLCLLSLSIIITSFCSLSVLCVLIRPGPGEGSGKRERADQSKQRAFNTITAILCMLWLWFVGLIISITVQQSGLLEQAVACAIAANLNWIILPYSLVSPLLYLHRAGKLSCCYNR